MLGTLTEKLQGVVKKLRGLHKLSEENIAEAVSEVRLALLEADVNYSVVKTLIKRIKENALGTEVVKSVSPGQQFIKVVHDQLILLMGGTPEEKVEKSQEKGIREKTDPLSVKTAENLENLLNLKSSKNASVIMVCGLQGSGKTTFCAKLAKYVRKKGLAQRPLLAACDLQRPAAIQQLQTLGTQADVPVFTLPGVQDPLAVAKMALEKMKSAQHDLLIVDTAGRLHLDEELMQQLEKIKALLSPSEILFVANAATGQDAVNVASEFCKRIEMTGTVLTMLDGNTRAGAAISIREVTGKPLKFEGIGEKLDDLQPFNPSSMADRILGMGDTINLVRKAQEHISEDEAKKLEQKLRSATFTYLDYLNQIQMVKKMGSFKSLISMLPGMSQMADLNIDDQQMFKVEAIILSMTEEERSEECELIPSRRRRIAQGSGTSLDDVNRLVKSFKQAKQFFKNMPNMKQLQKMMGGGALWR